MRIAAFVAFVAVVHIGSASIAAQQSTNLFAPKRKPPAAQRFLFPTPTPTVALRPQPAVVCGLTLIPGDPRTDPGIRHEVSENGRKFEIQSVDPKVCQRSK